MAAIRRIPGAITNTSRHSWRTRLAFALPSAFAIACSAGTSGAPSDQGSAGAGGGSNSGNGGTGFNVGGAAGGAAPKPAGPWKLPQGFTATQFGGYKLGAAFDGANPPAGIGAGGANQDGCGATILGVVRDFQSWTVSPGGHPDFEHFWGTAPTTGLVQPDLGTDSKPVYTGICEKTAAGGPCPFGEQTTSKAAFDQWYNYAADINKAYVVYLSLQPNQGLQTFYASLYFPLDGAGWGNTTTATGQKVLGEDGKPHNFGFTTEIHTEFKYNGGELFTFIGDDDVWVYINKKLAVDLGGLHSAVTGTVSLNQKATDLGITQGKNYPLDLFQAERHSGGSHFRIDTNLEFTNCGLILR